MSWNDLRKGRYSSEYQIYFITFVVNNREPVFCELSTSQIFCNTLHLNELKTNSKWLTWVLMPDHFHGLVQLLKGSTIHNVIHHLKGRSSHQINQSLNRSGKFWQNSYFDRQIRKEDDIKEIARYIVANPIRAGLVKRVGDYPYWDSIYL